MPRCRCLWGEAQAAGRDFHCHGHSGDRAPPRRVCCKAPLGRRGGRNDHRSLQRLSRTFHLPKQRKRLDAPSPYFAKQTENPLREGFVKDSDFRSLLAVLPRRLHSLALVCYFSCVAFGEAVSIRWMKVNLVRKAITLGAAQTKKAEPRIAPLADEIASISRKCPVPRAGFSATRTSARNGKRRVLK
jgi:hypothetical protein